MTAVAAAVAAAAAAVGLVCSGLNCLSKQPLSTPSHDSP
jgi:hypothetical protein